jgi:hypothetical protein
VVLAGIFSWSILQVKNQTTSVSASVNDKQATLNALKKKVLPIAQDASDRLSAVKYVQDTQTRFSLLISDIAKVEPDGVSIDSLTLTGNDKASVRIGISSMTYDQVLAFRNAIITSPRVSGADIETITSQVHDGYSFVGSVVVGFKPGQAK